MNQMQQDLQNELLTANQLLRLISIELQNIINLTNPGGDFEANINKNTSLMRSLANIQQIDFEKLPPFVRKQIGMTTHTDHSMSLEQHSTLRNDSEMEES